MDLLKRQGLSTDQIRKKVSKYEDAGILYDEAEEAVEMLDKIRESEKEALVRKAEADRQQAIAIQKQFVASVEQEINSLKDIRGIPVSDRERKQLLDYMLKPTRSGQTQFVEDYQSSVHNFVESAYWTLFKDKVVSSSQKAGAKSALDQLKEKMAQNVRPRSTGDVKTSSGSTKSFWETLE